MCGIFGFVDWRGERPADALLGRATNLLRHRGPDGGGYWSAPEVYLGHRRLAIIDLAGGHQPMASADGRVVVTFNGEIYNFPELREELRAQGVAFRTSSDTEVLVEGYRVWGPGVVERLDGMFAFGLYDRRERSVLLARDRFGEKPLLYSASAGRLVFASEMGPLAAVGAGARALDLDALGGFLCLNYVPGTSTLMQGIHRVAPGTWQRHAADGSTERAVYWTAGRGAQRGEVPADGEALLDAMQARVDEAVRLTLRSDVPVGLFLSGGTDSALVAESAARQGHLAAAFCVDFDEQGFSEWDRAQHVATRLGVELVRVPLRPQVLEQVESLASHLDDPVADSSAMAVWTVAEAAARRVKVVLSGDGGDELFGGYLTYASTRWHGRVAPLLPRPLRALAARVAEQWPLSTAPPGLTHTLARVARVMPLDTRVAHFAWNGAWTPAQAARLVRGEAARTAARTALATTAARNLPARPSLHDLQVSDIAEYLPNDILAKVDRATMAHGLESRAPLLGPRVAALALALPDGQRTTSRAHTKIALRRLCARHFGAAHAQAPKMGFTVPLHRWLRTSGRSVLDRMLAPDRVAALGVLDAGAVQHAVAAHRSGHRALGWELWGLMTLVAWHEARVTNPPALASLPDARDLVAVTVPERA